jgi:hypothetical protein
MFLEVLRATGAKASGAAGDLDRSLVHRCMGLPKKVIRSKP